jgi:hypothetical protein
MVPAIAFRSADDVGLEHDVTDFRIGLQVLRQDVDVMARDRVVDLAQHAGNVAVDMD